MSENAVARGSADRNRAIAWAAQVLGPVVDAEVVYDHSDAVTTRVRCEGGTGYLKQGPGLVAEADKLRRLEVFGGEVGGLRIPELLAVQEGDGSGPDRLLTAEVPGRDLTRLVDQPERVVRLLASALRMLHAAPTAPLRGLPGAGVEAGAGAGAGVAGAAHPALPDAVDDADVVVIHGDACLPNVLVDAAGEEPTGLVDVGEMRLGRREDDLAAACWSIGYNVGIEWGSEFLRHYGWDHDDEQTARDLAAAYGEL